MDGHGYGLGSVQVLACSAGAEKSRMSRVTAALERRNLLIRRDNREDGRSPPLRLSDDARLVAEICAVACRRNEAMLRHMSGGKRRQLMALLGKATEGAMELLAETRAATAGRGASG